MSAVNSEKALIFSALQTSKRMLSRQRHRQNSNLCYSVPKGSSGLCGLDSVKNNVVTLYPKFNLYHRNFGVFAVL